MPAVQSSEAAIDDYVKKVLDDAPPLTDEQRDDIAGLLRAGGGAPMKACLNVTQADCDLIEDVGPFEVEAIDNQQTLDAENRCRDVPAGEEVGVASRAGEST
jgi:hypothetical protein